MKLPDHLFLSSSGDLHDTRRADWAAHPLRAGYSRHVRDITNALQLRATLRAGPYAWPGGYPLFFITSDGAALSFETVRAEYRLVSGSIRSGSNDSWRVVACDVNYEDDDLTDDHTGARIPCAHGGKECF